MSSRTLRSASLGSIAETRYFPGIVESRTFAFGDDSHYQALKVGDHQYEAIGAYEDKNRIPVFYLLYHPPRVPHQVEVPLASPVPAPRKVKAGARVLPAKDLRATLSGKPTNYTPTYGDLRGVRRAAGSCRRLTGAAGRWRTPLLGSGHT